MANTKRISFEADEEFYDGVAMLAKIEGLSVNDYMKGLAVKNMEDWKDNLRRMEDYEDHLIVADYMRRKAAGTVETVSWKEVKQRNGLG